MRTRRNHPAFRILTHDLNRRRDALESHDADERVLALVEHQDVTQRQIDAALGTPPDPDGGDYAA